MINLKELKQSLNKLVELQAQRAEEYRMTHLLHEDTKFYFSQIDFEITRKCNLKCTHCMRGDAQHLSMKKEVIDKILDSSGGIAEIFFTGGEPFLEPEIIEHIIDEIIRRDFECYSIAVITNGTIMNDNAVRCIKSLNKFAEWSNKKYGDIAKSGIGISNDHFHNEKSSNACMEFYKPYIGEFLELTMHGDISDDRLVKAGRAVQTGVAESDFRKFHALPRRICIEPNNIIKCTLRLTSEGNIVLPEFDSWQEMDENSMGNIMQESLVKIFERNQWSELCCNEITKIGNYINIFNKSEETKDSQKFFVAGYVRARGLRYRMHLLFPYLDYYQCTMLSLLLLEQETKGHWLNFIFNDYQQEMFTPERIDQMINAFISINEQRKREGKPKVQLVPYNPDINHIDGCTDLDEQS